MKDKLVKAYTAAWKWPLLFSHDPVVIWTSRLIVFAIPLGLIALTILTGVPQYGWGYSLFFAALVTLALLGITIKMFYREYESVEDFKTRETRIKEFFHGFPAYTDIPLIEYETGEWVSYGHVDPEDFVDAIIKVVLGATEDPAAVDKYAYAGLASTVGHTYATFRDEGHWADGLELCKAHAEDCFPITRLKL